MSIWPSNFKILRAGYSNSILSKAIKSEMGVGPAKTRQRSKLTMRSIKFGLLLNAEEMEQLEQFYLNNQTNWFDFTLPENGKAVRARFNMDALEKSVNTILWAVNIELEAIDGNY